MDAIKQWAVCLCAAVLAAGVVTMLAPEGGTKKILKTVVSVFILCCMLSPLAQWDGNLQLAFAAQSDNAREEKAETLQNALDRQVLTACEKKMRDLAEENLTAAGIKIDSITVSMDIGTDNSIIINELVVKVKKKQDQMAAKETLKQTMGVDCRIEASENGGIEDEGS